MRRLVRRAWPSRIGQLRAFEGFTGDWEKAWKVGVRFLRQVVGVTSLCRDNT